MAGNSRGPTPFRGQRWARPRRLRVIAWGRCSVCRASGPAESQGRRFLEASSIVHRSRLRRDGDRQPRLDIYRPPRPHRRAEPAVWRSHAAAVRGGNKRAMTVAACAGGARIRRRRGPITGSLVQAPKTGRQPRDLARRSRCSEDMRSLCVGIRSGSLSWGRRLGGTWQPFSRLSRRPSPALGSSRDPGFLYHHPRSLGAGSGGDRLLRPFRPARWRQGSASAAVARRVAWGVGRTMSRNPLRGRIAPRHVTDDSPPMLLITAPTIGSFPSDQSTQPVRGAGPKGVRHRLIVVDGALPGCDVPVVPYLLPDILAFLESA